MPDRLTDEERAAIAEAVRRGLVRKIPIGESGLTRYRYDADRGDLVPVGSDPAWSQDWTQLRQAKVARRMAAIRSALEAGQAAAQIASDWGMSEGALRNDCRRFGIKLTPEGRLLQPIKAAE